MDPRQFLSWDVPALQATAAALFDAHPGSGVADMRGTVVALPGARAGRRLKELLIEHAQQRAVRLVPPRITTMGALPELLYEPHLPIAEASLTRRIWAHQLRRLEEDALALLFPRAPGRDDLRGWMQLAREMERLHALLGAGGRRFSDAASCCGGDMLFNDEARWQVLARVQDGYCRTLERLGRTDTDQARRHALALGSVNASVNVWLAGVADMPEIVRALLHAVMAHDATRVRVLVHAPDELRDAFDTLGAARPDVWRNAHIPLHDDRLSVVGHPSNQAAEVARAIASFDGRYGADEIVIAVPDEEVVPYIEQRLAAAGVPARYAGGTPVERTAPFRLLAAIAEYLASSASEALAALVRHPDMAHWLRRHNAPGDAVLDRYLGSFLPAQLHARGPMDAGVASMLDALHGDALLGALRGRRRLSAWMAPILELLAALYRDDVLQRDVPASRRRIRLFEQLRDAAAAHARVPEELDDPCDAASAIRILLDDIRGTVLPADADDAAVELLGWLELHLDDAPAAILTGMNEPFVPEAVNADAFLPNSLRTRLGIEDNDRRYARYAYQLTALLHTRADVHVIAGRRTVLGDPLRPSRLLLTERGPALAQRVHRFLSGAAAMQLDPEPAHDVPLPESSAFHLPPEPVLRLDVPDSISISAFKGLITDPYMFALESLLRLDIRDDAAREMDPLHFGSFAHRVLEQFGISAAAHSTDEDAIIAELSRLLDEELRTRFAAVPHPAVRIQAEQLRLRLRAFARSHAAWIADGWRIVAVEASTPEEGVPLEVDGAIIRLRGRIDRIDYNAEQQRWAVLDYKTGDRAQTPEETHRKSGAWRDLQLPLYRFILPHVRTAAGDVVFQGDAGVDVLLGYIVLCGEPDSVSIIPAEWGEDDFESAEARVQEAVRVLRSGVYTYERPDGAWLEDDMKALLGFGRLVAVEDDEEVVREDG